MTEAQGCPPGGRTDLLSGLWAEVHKLDQDL